MLLIWRVGDRGIQKDSGVEGKEEIAIKEGKGDVLQVSEGTRSNCQRTAAF